MTSARGCALLAVALVVVAAVLAIGAAIRGPIDLPVLALLGGEPLRLAVLHLRVATPIPLLLIAAVAGARAAGRLSAAVVVALGAAAPIVLFLVARLNGVVDAVALVLVYASAGGGVLLRSLHRPGGNPTPLRWSAVLGIVPWGVIAFTQVGGLLAGTPPSVSVRVLTVVVLAASIAEFVVVYRRRDRPLGPMPGLALVAAPAVLLGALALIG